MTSSDFEDALIDVRKAYRLLYLYQRRVMDLVQFIGDSLGFRYSGGWSWFSHNTPKDGKGVIANWAWDWLNMYFYEFLFTDKKIQENNIRFSVIIQSDTGYYDSENKNKLNIEEFASAESASTRVIFLIGKNCWHTEFKEDFGTDSLLYKNNSGDYTKTVGNKILLAKAFPLTKFINADTTMKCLEELVCFCRDKGIPEIGLIS